MRYADPTLCPDCRHDLPQGASICPTCGLLVRHPLAVELYGVLTRADRLVATLRTTSTTFHGDAPGGPVSPSAAPAAGSNVAVGAAQPAATPAGRPAPPPPPAPPMSAPAPGMTPYPAPRPSGPTPRTGLGTASVPRILLGLGALCLLVAAIVFLAVSWSVLGVGGRTAVLATMTIAAGAASFALHRIGLRIAAESMSIVALGLLALDVLGAGSAGWLGDGNGRWIATVAGLVVAVAAVATGAGSARGARPALVAPQIIAGIALVVAWIGAVAATAHPLIAGHLMTALAIGAVALARRISLLPLAWSAGVAAALAWAGTAGDAFVRAVIDPDLRSLWLDGSVSTGWSLLVSAAVLVVPGLLLHDRRLLLAGASGSALVVTVVATLPSVDTDSRTVGLVAVVVTAAWTLALGMLPRTARVVAIAPAACGSLVLVGLSLATCTMALERWGRLSHQLDESVDVRLSGPDPITEPLLLLPSLLVVLAFAALLAPDRRRVLMGALHAAMVTTGVALAATLASYDVALVWPLAALVVTGTASAALALTSRGPSADVLTVTAVGLSASTALLALPSAPLMLGTAVVGVATTLTLALAGSSRAGRVVAGLGTPPLVALAVTGAAHLVDDGGAAWVAVPTLLAVGVLALALPRVEIECSALLTALVVLPVSLAAAADAGGLCALWLTVAGLLVCATALLHAERRPMIAVGLGLLLVALWVRLADLDVRAPEAYSLPLAAAMLGLGLWQMRRSPDLSSAAALTPGLLVATVPTLLWVLGDPLSLRALILGGGCLVLTIAGAMLRWSAPLVIGAAVGTVVVLRELGPYAGDVPQWVWIGLAGGLLTVVGITWERRLVEVRSTIGYLGRLR